MISKAVRQWLKYAATDLRLSQTSIDFSAEFKAIAAFHAQQCAEKAIKAYLTHHKVRFPKSHDIEALVEFVKQVDAPLAKKLEKCKALTIYAVTYRYPDAERKPLTLAKVRAAIKLAKSAYDLCNDAIE